MSQRRKRRSGVEAVLGTPHALLVVFLAALPAAAGAAPATPQEQRRCLLWAGEGCSSITKEELCLGSQDGRNWKGSPCTWCDGTTQCTGSRCQAADEAKGVSLALREAACGNLTAEEPEMDRRSGAEESEARDVARRRGALFEEVHTVGQLDMGQACRHNTITDKKSSYYWIFSASSLESCQDRCRSYEGCTGIQYSEDDEQCEVWWEEIHWSMASKGQLCYKVAASDLPGRLRKPRNTYCLSYTLYIDGCTGIEDEHLCLNSRDGRKEGSINGSRIYGEPCVWCGGEACTSLNDHRCEPYDWLLQHTRDLAFSESSSHFSNISVARCDEDWPESSTTADFRHPTAGLQARESEVSVELGTNTTTEDPNASIAAIVGREELGDSHSFQFPWWGWLLAFLAVCAVLAAIVAMFFRAGGEAGAGGGGGGGQRRRGEKKTRGMRQLEAESTEETTPMLEAAGAADKDAAAMDTEGPPEPPLPLAFSVMQPPLYQPSFFGPPPLSMPRVGMLTAGYFQQQPQPQQLYSPLSVVEIPMARAITPLHRLPPPMRATQPAAPAQVAPAEPFAQGQRF